MMSAPDPVQPSDTEKPAESMVAPWSDPFPIAHAYPPRSPGSIASSIPSSGYSSVPGSAYWSAPSTAYYSALSGTTPHYAADSWPNIFARTPYFQFLQNKALWPVPPDLEQNWSGRGQHVEYTRDEKASLSNSLKIQDNLGSTGSAIVQSVLCKRILLARKTIRCNRTLTKEKAIEEVAHINCLTHSHIVRVIGTYVMGHELSILLYPVADCNLEVFLLDANVEGATGPDWEPLLRCLERFFSCLSNAIQHIHERNMKHMDIKPKNLLIRRRKGVHKIYIADFGIARSYKTLEETETDGPTMFTRKYAAPEVVDHEKRGLNADIFSLGCVFVEILSTLVGITGANAENTPGIGEHFHSVLQELLKSNENGDASYQANIGSVHIFLDSLVGADIRFRDNWKPAHPESLKKYGSLIKRMTDLDPAGRPSSQALVRRLGQPSCCREQQDAFEVA